MGTQNRRLDLETWVERLIRAPLPSSGGESVDALLLDAVQECTRVPALGLWLASPGGWSLARARGPVDLRPGPARVAGVLEGELDGGLGERERVLVCGDAEDGAALVLGGGRAREPDLAHALLVTYWCLTRGGSGPDALPGRQRPGADGPH